MPQENGAFLGQGERREGDVVVDQELRTEIAEKIEAATVVVLLAGSFIVLGGIALEMFLNVPVSNTLAHILGASGSGLAGAALGKRLNRRENN